MNDHELTETWATLTPTTDQRRRINARVFAWLDARDTSLAAEWLRLFKVEPFAAVAFTAASAVALVAATPLLWLARALL